MKSGQSAKSVPSKNQVSKKAPAKKSRHGGPRLGSGRKPGKGNKPTFSHEACAAALATAVEGKPAFLFIAAMRALEAPIDDVRGALGLSREAFVSDYGQFISALADVQRVGMAAHNSQRAAEATKK